MEHFNSFIFQKSGPANKQHTYKWIKFQFYLLLAQSNIIFYLLLYRHKFYTWLNLKIYK